MRYGVPWLMAIADPWVRMSAMIETEGPSSYSALS